MRSLFRSPLFVALGAALLCVLTALTQPLDHVYWNVWFKNAGRQTADSAVIVSLDGGVPLNPNSVAASPNDLLRLVQTVQRMRPSHIFLDAIEPLSSSKGLTVSGVDLSGELPKGLTLVERGRLQFGTNQPEQTTLQNRQFTPPPGVKVAASAWNVNFIGYAESSPMQVVTPQGVLPTVAAFKQNENANSYIYPDFRIDPASIKSFDAKRLLAGQVDEGQIAGRNVFITLTNPNADTAVGYFGHHANVPGAVADIAAMHGSVGQQALRLGELPLLAMVSVLFFAARRIRRRRTKMALYIAVVASVLLGPGLLREFGVIIDAGAAIIAIAAYVPIRSSQKWRHRMRHTSSASGLPNMDALSADGIAASQDVVAASISQYEQMLATLPQELHGECARQIARRLSLGAGDRQIFDNDNGHFVWLENSRTLEAIIDHFEGLKALFSSPIIIGGHTLDTTIHFGLDRNIDSKAITRIQSALASAGEAQSKGKLYEEFGEQRLAQAPWELSLHARIDEGLRNGDIWLALQPQYDFRTGRISGAEALIRWNDPERGAIPPDAFILQAERAGRIESITYWVLEKAIAMSQALNRVAAPFQISVNLSARMVDHPALVSRIADIARENGLDCSLITFEVTETFSMANRAQAKQNLAALRAMGFRLSIDDFGTGQASLSYLAEIPSDEIKLDRRFVQAIVSDYRERCIVNSVISLAHSLGQEVVAEGIEDPATLELLENMRCDLAQGYHVGRPVAFDQFMGIIQMSQSAQPLRRVGEFTTC